MPKKYYLVLASIPEDHEDTITEWYAISAREAVTLAQEFMYADQYAEEATQAAEDNYECHGEALFVTAVIESDSPMTVCSSTETDLTEITRRLACARTTP
jgi:hypothetical protein